MDVETCSFYGHGKETQFCFLKTNYIDLKFFKQIMNQHQI